MPRPLLLAPWPLPTAPGDRPSRQVGHEATSSQSAQYAGIKDMDIDQQFNNWLGSY
ncbi:hypothetical protein PVAP13_2NG533103 [Panicum virgatum]|uniref:Uncharacterized protein n=1 Tax=Panicum virgatum TaxID=38727 RepID=A0A8T0VCT2_PANVG|nr:hypothetical protein PVAP13_2NG533103 [Panicum virgatum]